MARIAGIDALRGTAIVMMIAYHLFIDLDFFRVLSVDLSGLGWILFQRTIAFMFLFVAGISLALMEGRKKGRWEYLKRAAMLGTVALLITAVTWIYPHERFIMFGIIHLIAASTLIAPMFLRLGLWNVFFGFLLIAAGFFLGTAPAHGTDYLFFLGINSPGYWPLDYYPLIPWFGIILLGIYAGQRFIARNAEKIANARGDRLIDRLAFLGRHSLLIYLIHQPILAALILAWEFAARI
ncbi:MAG: heparan-alpha-glucosaminide N-acetyltransferase [Candidatus Micrarchaeota archaeon]